MKKPNLQVVPSELRHLADLRLQVANRELESALEEARNTNILLRQINKTKDDEISRLTALAGRDPLTGLLNLRGFEAAFHRQVSRLLRTLRQYEAKSVVAVIVIDLNRFTAINEAFGHPFANEKLIGFAGRLNEVFHRHEGEDLVTRFGGDEFTVVMVGTDIQSIVRKATEFCKEPDLDPRLDLQGTGFLSASIGVAAFTVSKDAQEADIQRAYEIALEDADRALYKAKEEARVNDGYVIQYASSI